MLVTAIVWIYAALRAQAPDRRYASDQTAEYDFNHLRRALTNEIGHRVSVLTAKAPTTRNTYPLVAAVIRLVV